MAEAAPLNDPTPLLAAICAGPSLPPQCLSYQPQLSVFSMGEGLLLNRFVSVTLVKQARS